MRTCARILAVLCVAAVAVATAGGCAGDGGAVKPGDEVKQPFKGVPRGARLVAEHRGRMMFVAPAKGVAWLYDVEDAKVIYSSPMNGGDQLVFYPEGDLIRLNGSVVVKNVKLYEDHVHRIYYLKG